MFLKRTLVGTSLRGMLTIDERVILLSVLVSMRECDLDILTFKMNNGVKPIVGHRIVEEIFKSVAAHDAPSVIHNDETRIKIGIVSEHRFNDIVVKLIVNEKRIIRFKEDERTVFVLCRLRFISRQITFLEANGPHLTVAKRLYFKVRTQCINGFETYSVQAYALFKCLGIIFSTRVEHTHGLD